MRQAHLWDCSYGVGLRWRRIDVSSGPDDPGPAPAICWDFDEWDWNIG